METSRSQESLLRFVGLMERGRWYATLVPMIDGRLVVLGGFVGFDMGYPAMYPFENNDFVEFFDPRLFNASNNPQLAWRKVNVKSSPNGPFTNLINRNFQPTPNVNCTSRCIKDNQYDVFKLYEQAYLTAEGRIYLTREGDFVSARTQDTAFMRKTTATYHMHLSGTRQVPSITFSTGPSRSENVSSYGTTINDPNSGRIALFGGQPTSPGIFLYQKGTREGSEHLVTFNHYSFFFTKVTSAMREDVAVENWNSFMLPCTSRMVVIGPWNKTFWVNTHKTIEQCIMLFYCLHRKY
jgi:hypothetical protein